MFRHIHAELKRGIRPETPNHLRNQKLYEVGIMKKKMTITIKPEQKMRIATDEETQMFLHMKRKGSSMTKNDKAYRRREKHHKPNY